MKKLQLLIALFAFNFAADAQCYPPYPAGSLTITNTLIDKTSCYGMPYKQVEATFNFSVPTSCGNIPQAYIYHYRNDTLIGSSGPYSGSPNLQYQILDCNGEGVHKFVLADYYLYLMYGSSNGIGVVSVNCPYQCQFKANVYTEGTSCSSVNNSIHIDAMDVCNYYANYPVGHVWDAYAFSLTNSGISYYTQLPADSTHAIFNNVPPGKYMVWTSDETGNFGCDQYDTVTVLCPKPTSGFNAVNITATSATLKWNVKPCALSYQVRYRPSGSSSAWILKQTTTNTGSKSITGLLPSTTYEWQIRSKCFTTPSIEWTPWTSKHSVTTAALKSGEEIQTDLSELESLNVELYPNPASSVLNIKFESENSIADIIILNTLGETCYYNTFMTDDGVFNKNIEISYLKSGIYSVLIRTKSGVSQKRFVKN